MQRRDERSRGVEYESTAANRTIDRGRQCCPTPPGWRFDNRVQDASGNWYCVFEEIGELGSRMKQLCHPRARHAEPG